MTQLIESSYKGAATAMFLAACIASLGACERSATDSDQQHVRFTAEEQRAYETASTHLRSLGANVTTGVQTNGIGRATIVSLHGASLTNEFVGIVSKLPGRLVLDIDVKEVADNALKGLDGIQLYGLHLGKTPIRDSGLSTNKEMTLLRVCRTHDPAATDSDLAILARMPNLRELDLSGTRIAGTALRYVAAMGDLREFYAEDTRISDSGVTSLGECVRLESVSLSNTPVTDRGIRDLHKLQSLQTLTLDDTGISDSALASIAELNLLVEVNVNGTRVSAHGLSELSKLPHLTLVSLKRTGIDPASAKSALPNIKVVADSTKKSQ